MENIADVALEEVEYLQIEKDNIPYSFTYDYKGNIFEFYVRYNDEHDYFTIDLYSLDNDEKRALVLGEKIMLGQILFDNIAYTNIDLPMFMPYDFTNTIDKMGFDEIDNIYLVVVEDDTIW